MANDLNQCNFIGRLGGDPEQRFTSGGDQVSNFRIAVGWKGNEKEGTEWISCSAYGKLAEICNKYLAKGSRVFVTGRYFSKKYQASDGSDRYSSGINLISMQMLDSKREQGQGQEPEQGQTAPKTRTQHSPAINDFDDDLPF